MGLIEWIAEKREERRRRNEQIRELNRMYEQYEKSRKRLEHEMDRTITGALSVNSRGSR